MHRRALRPAARGHPALRPEYVAAARAGHRGGARGALRPAPQRVPRQHVRRRGRRRGGVRGCRSVADPGGCRRRRGAGHHRQDVPARGRSRRGAHPDLLHVRRPDHAAGRDPRRRPAASGRARASASTWSGSCRVWRVPTSSGCARPTTRPARPSPSAPSPRSWTRRPPSAAGRPSWSSTRPMPSSRPRPPYRSSTGTRGSSWCARCPRHSPWRACASATPSPSARPSSAWSVCGRRAASPPCPRRSRRPRCGTRSRRAGTPRAWSQERVWLAGRLADVGLPAYPSITNFVLVPIGSVAGGRGPDRDAAARGHRDAHLRTRQPAPGPPAAHGPDPGRERAPARCAPDMAGREASMTSRHAHRGPGADHPRDDHPGQRRPGRLGPLGHQHGCRLLRPPADLARAPLAHRHRDRGHGRPAHRRAPHRGGRRPGPG